MSDIFVARANRLAAREVAGEMVILKADDSSLYVLNAVGTVVWQAADGRTSLGTIVDDICREYSVDRETALHDVTEFVDALASHGVMRTSPEAIGSDDCPRGLGPTLGG